MMAQAIDKAPRIDAEALAGQVAAVNVMLGSEAGAMEVLNVTEQGVVQIRFHGMCGSCMSRPMTTRSTVRPMLMQVAGVTGVEDLGFRVSSEAQTTIRNAQLRAAQAATAAAKALQLGD